MAEDIIEKLEEQLNCSICLDIYTDPKLLQCMHVFCQQCLVPLVTRGQNGQLSLTCPTDRQVTPVPARGAAGLQSAFHINHLLDIYNDAVKKLDNPAATRIPCSTAKELRSHCVRHKGKEVELYCETCDKLVCIKCVLKGGYHHRHNCEEVDLAFDRYRKKIISSEIIIKEALADIKTRCGEISNQRAAIEDNIYATFRRLREVLTVRETELIGQLHQMTQAKLKGLSAQSNQIETTLAELNSCLQESLHTGQKINMLRKMTSVEHGVRSMPPDMLKPNTKANIGFSAAGVDITKMCQKYGLVFSQGYHLEVNPDYKYIYRSAFYAVLQADCGDEPYEDIEKTLSHEITMKSFDKSYSLGVKKIAMGEYQICYQPTSYGDHQLHVKVKNKHIRGSPFSFYVHSDLIKHARAKLGLPDYIPPPWSFSYT